MSKAVKNIAVILLLICLTACSELRRNQYYGAPESKYNKMYKKGDKINYYTSIPFFENTDADYKRLDFGMTGYGGKLNRNFVTLFVFVAVPIPHVDGTEISEDNSEFRIFMENMNRYEDDVLTDLNFSVVVGGKTYKGERKLAEETVLETFRHTKNKKASKGIMGFAFPLKVKDVGRKAKLIIEYKGLKKEMTIKLRKDWTWTILSVAP